LADGEPTEVDGAEFAHVEPQVGFPRHRLAGCSIGTAFERERPGGTPPEWVCDLQNDSARHLVAPLFERGGNVEDPHPHAVRASLLHSP